MNTFKTGATTPETRHIPPAILGVLWANMDENDRWEKNGKRGMLGHPKGLCWLLWFLGLYSMFVHYV